MKFKLSVSSLSVCCYLLLLLLNFALAVDIQNAGSNTREARKLFGGYKITPRFCKATRQPSTSLGGPNICMFNHECSQRNGQVVGACMDGFLFGACCQIPTESIGDLISSDQIEDNKLPSSVATATLRPQTTPMLDITSSGLSQITATLLNNGGILPTAGDNAVVQIDNDQPHFATTGITHPPPDTILLHQNDNDINFAYFRPTDKPKTTVRMDETTLPYSATRPRPMFKPKPIRPSDTDKYVLVPTITKQPAANQTQAFDSIVNIIHMLNQTTTSSTTKRAPSTSYVFGTSTRRPTTKRKPPSTSYTFSSTTVPPRKTPSTNKKTNKPQKKRPTTTSITKTPFNTTPSTFSTPKQPPSTSYVYSPLPTRRPPSTVDSHIVGPGFSVTSNPGQYSSTLGYPSAAPTVIVLSPVTDKEPSSTAAERPSTYQSPTRVPPRKPINHVTINNHVTQNIYSTSERPSPTILITPKPNIASSIRPQSDSVEVGTSADDLMNFPPVRNPNLNMSAASLNDNDITTPAFIEDEDLNKNVESFVNKIIQGLQEPFDGLKDIVMNNKTTTTTKKPVRKPGTTTRKPSRPITTTTTRKPSSTKRPQTTTTKRTRKPITTTTVQSLIEDENVVIDENEEYRNQCGIRPLIKTGRIVGGKGATFGEFPWQVLVRESTWLGLFTKNKCGGVLISSKYVMTAAHCQPGFLASLVAVVGEFDISGELETKRSISRNVKRVIVHRQYDAATFENDLALLELEAPLQFDAHIVPICLPREGEDFTGRMATVTGWGRLKYGGGVPSVLQEVQVPIMENHVCQEMFRTAGHSKVILESFLCAGYANGQKDSCEGDSGGPLVLQRPDGRYQLAGTVSHGIKCAAPYLPGVYMRTTFYKPWITSITGLD